MRSLPPPPNFPKLSPAPTTDELARCYGELAATLAEQYVRMVDAFEMLSASMGLGLQMRAKLPSLQDIEHVAERIERAAEGVEDATSPGGRRGARLLMTSDRVREIIQSHEDRLERTKLEADAKLAAARRWQVVLAGLSAGLAVATGVLVWALTHR